MQYRFWMGRAGSSSFRFASLLGMTGLLKKKHPIKTPARYIFSGTESFILGYRVHPINGSSRFPLA